MRAQFLVEAILLSTLGGVLGLLLGVGITAGYAALENITFSMPLIAGVIGLGAAIIVGALAGISPAGRAARLSPPTRSVPGDPRVSPVEACGGQPWSDTTRPVVGGTEPSNTS